MCRSLLAVRCPLFAVCVLLYVVVCSLCVVRRASFAVRCLMFVVICVLCVVSLCCSLCVVCGSFCL